MTGFKVLLKKLRHLFAAVIPHRKSLWKLASQKIRTTQTPQMKNSSYNLNQASRLDCNRFKRITWQLDLTLDKRAANCSKSLQRNSKASTKPTSLWLMHRRVAKPVLAGAGPCRDLRNTLTMARKWPGRSSFLADSSLAYPWSSHKEKAHLD